MDAELKPNDLDRKAAADSVLKRLVFQHGGHQPWMDESVSSILRGEQDDHWDVQAFAQHRLDTLERAAVIADRWRDENKASAAAARKRGCDDGLADQIEGAAIECNALAQAIRAAKEQGNG